MQFPPEFRADRLIRVFRRTGGNGTHTKPFDEFPPAARERIEAQCPLSPGEVPVVACVLTQNHWTLITTERLVWMTADGVREISRSELWDLRLMDAVARFWREGKPPTTRLDCATRDGQAFQLELESDPGFTSFAIVLHMIMRINHDSDNDSNDEVEARGADHETGSMKGLP
jgi:hypothetical protein